MTPTDQLFRGCYLILLFQTRSMHADYFKFWLVPKQSYPFVPRTDFPHNRLYSTARQQGSRQHYLENNYYEIIIAVSNFSYRTSNEVLLYFPLPLSLDFALIHVKIKSCTNDL